MTSTIDRVPEHTAADVNQQIREQMADRVQFFAAHPERIPQRLNELDDEWDIERAIEANAATLAFAGVALGAAADRRWLILPALVTAFLFQHAIQGWCPPVPVLRRLGFRTAHEIEQERHALKAIRGDFESVSNSYSKPAAALRAVAT
jgi:hypothetical protein